MKAVQRPRKGNVVHWRLRPVTDLMEPSRPGWLMQRGLPQGIGGIQEEFDLPTAYPWFLESRRAIQHQSRLKEMEGGSTSAPPRMVFLSSLFVLLLRD